MNKSQYAKIVKNIEKHMNQIGKERDSLDDMIDQLNSLKEDCEQAWDCLQEARDALSRMV